MTDDTTRLRGDTDVCGIALMNRYLSIKFSPIPTPTNHHNLLVPMCSCVCGGV